MTTAFTQPRGVKGAHRLVCGIDPGAKFHTHQFWIDYGKKHGAVWNRDSNGNLAYVSKTKGVLLYSKGWRYEG